jgi:hypothetical protein
VSGQAGRFDMITLSLNIGSLIGILGLATFICDIVALYVHRQSDVYRQQKFQDVDLNLVRLETLNNVPIEMMSEESKRKHEQQQQQQQQQQFEQSIFTNSTMNDTDRLTQLDRFSGDQRRQNKRTHFGSYDQLSATSTIHINRASAGMFIDTIGTQVISMNFFRRKFAHVD